MLHVIQKTKMRNEGKVKVHVANDFKYNGVDG